MGSFLDRLVRTNARLISEWLFAVADAIERAAPGVPAQAIAGWQSAITPGKEVELDMGEITVPDTQAEPLHAAVSFVDAHGHPTTADDVPQWTSSDESVATVAAGEDGLSADVTIAGTPGSAVVTVNSTNDDGSTVTATGLVNVSAGDAAVGSVDFTEGSTETPPA